MIKYLLLFLSLFASYHWLSAEEKYEEEIFLQEPECLNLISSQRDVGGRWRLRFYNTCEQKVYALACVEERPNRFKLHNSVTKIPKRGYFDLYSYEGVAPLSVSWISSRDSEIIPPGYCGKAPSK